LEVEIEVVVDLRGRSGGGAVCRFDWEKSQVMGVLSLTSAFLVLYPSIGGIYVWGKDRGRKTLECTVGHRVLVVDFLSFMERRKLN
jgi:hypothetical protein